MTWGVFKQDLSARRLFRPGRITQGPRRQVPHPGVLSGPASFRRTRLGRLLIVLVAVLFHLALPACVLADGQQYELFIERSPANAGSVTPPTGTHTFSPQSTVTLTADPEPGYRFAYWLGDVSDPASARTTVVLNEPKVVIAVFHPDSRRRVEDGIRPAGGGGGDPGMLLASVTDLSSPTWAISGGGHVTRQLTPAVIPAIHTPEPATIALLSLGILLLRRTRR
jgi:hypothetical protein